jgi:putative membrane protein
MSSALLSTFHLLALALGLPGVFLRGRALRGLATDKTALRRLFIADNLWGLAALLWIGTGLARLFGTFEKGSGYYLNSTSFLIKLGLFGVVFALELWPMITFIKWRRAQAKGLEIDTSKASTLARLNDVEVALILAIPFFASMMARGIGFTWFQ